jgi:hypothetical protein
MNANNSADCSVHIRILNKLRSEQYRVNSLATDYQSILENMQHMNYQQLQVELTNTPKSVYDVSYYRAAEKGDPCMHVILKGSKSTSVVDGDSPFYEPVRI